MKFVNTKPHDLKFEIDGVVYEVPVGGSCEIPDRIAYVVAAHGLPMKPAAEVEEAPKAASRRGKPTKDDAAMAAEVEEAPKPKRE